MRPGIASDHVVTGLLKISNICSATLHHPIPLCWTCSRTVVMLFLNTMCMMYSPTVNKQHHKKVSADKRKTDNRGRFKKGIEIVYWISDHDMVSVLLSFSPGNIEDAQATFRSLDFNQADFTQLNEIFDAVKWEKLVDSCSYEEFLAKLTQKVWIVRLDRVSRRESWSGRLKFFPPLQSAPETPSESKAGERDPISQLRSKGGCILLSGSKWETSRRKTWYIFLLRKILLLKQHINPP